VGAAIAAVTGLAAELMTDPAVLVTELARSASGVLAAVLAVAPVVPVVPGAIGVDAADVPDWSAPGLSSPVAAWACLEKRSKRNKIPAAAIANCAARTATRYADSCDIDSSHPLGNWTMQAGGRKAPDQTCTAVEDEAFCTATTVHH
jgi:hypothetical protein